MIQTVATYTTHRQTAVGQSSKGGNGFCDQVAINGYCNSF